jgi:predicted transcriptional regulator
MGKSGVDKVIEQRSPPGNSEDMTDKKIRFLTDVELEFMTRLWDLGTATVRDVQESLGPARKLAYTSAATILRILEQKGFVTSTKQGKTFVYQTTLSKDVYQTRSLKNLSEKLFDNAPAVLVARLVDDNDLSTEVLDEIRALIDKRLRDDHR